MKHLVFPTYEFAPVNPGGAGVLVSGAVRALAQAGYRCTVICAFPDAEVRKGQEFLASVGIDERVRLIQIETLAAPDGRSYPSEYEARSEQFARAIEALHAQDPIDLVEFPEYAGIGLGTFRRRFVAGALRGVQLVVRIHGSLEFIDQHEGVERTEVRSRMHRMERLGMRFADALLVPSHALGKHYAEVIGLDPSTLVVSPPPMETLLAELQSMPRLVDPAHFLFYGKLQEVKGCDTFARAAVGLLTTQSQLRWRFTLVGRNTWCTPHNRFVSQCLEHIVTANLREHFQFVEAIPRSALAHTARSAVAAVVPSRFETFCLAAHELRHVGVPLIVPRIPGFVDYLRPETGCLTYDGTPNGLMQAMLRLRKDAELRESLAARPAPSYGRFEDAYAAVLSGASGASTTSDERIAPAELDPFDWHAQTVVSSRKQHARWSLARLIG